MPTEEERLARRQWENQLETWAEEEARFAESEDSYVSYMTEVIECECGYEASRYEMEEHWCDDLEEIVNAVHTTEK